MKNIPFKSSQQVSIGTELEIQLVDPENGNLISSAKDLIRNISQSSFQERIKPEITQSMIEINSSVHQSPQTLYDEVLTIQDFLMDEANQLGIAFCGGGTHPFQKWSLTKIFPTKRFKDLSRQYRYLSKRATVFGLHVHVGCKNAEDAIYLTHALARYAPHFIALSASSPFYQGIDTGYHSSRLTIFTSYPTSGVMPYMMSWEEFSAYYYKMRNFGIVASMKDFYWDIRPKPEFGTVEIRLCDMPLSNKKVAMIAAYIQALSLYLLKERTFTPSPDLYFLYHFNRFQASRYGFEGEIIDHITAERHLIGDEILETTDRIQKYVEALNSVGWIVQLMEDVSKKRDDATTLRQILKQVGSFSKLVHEQCHIWSKR